MLHTFQPISTDMLDMNPFTQIGQEWMLVSAGDETKANTMTASWGGVGVMWGKNVATIYIRASRYTKEFIDSHDTFSITFLDKAYKNEMKLLGTVSGRNQDKMAEAKLHFNYSMDTPFVDEGNLVLICRKLSATPITKDQFVDSQIQEKWYSDEDYHTMYIGEILQIMVR
ncbi:MAG: flavin reductase [Roseburia sp.]